MADSDRIDIKSGSGSFLETNVTVEGQRYLVLTESDGISSAITRVYLSGRIIATGKTEFPAGKGVTRHLSLPGLMRRQHAQFIEELKTKIT